MSKEHRKKAIYDYFINVAKKENAEKHNKVSLESLLDDEGKENRVALVMPRSIGDLVMITSLLPSIKNLYANCNVYVFCEEKYFEVLEGNEYIHKLLPYSEQVDNQPLLEGQGNNKGYFLASFHPYFRTQKYLDYLHNGQGKTDFDITLDNANKNSKNYSHLLSAYALSCGVKVGDPQIQDTYLPLPFKKYIILHASSGMESKNYDYFTDVVGEILPHLEKEEIKIIQIGDKKDNPVSGCINFLGATSLKQTFFLIKNAMCVFGNDSFSAHVAGIYDVPLVCIYSILYSECCRPFFGAPEKQVIIDSDRNGDLPTFSSQEEHKMINRIMPETIAKSVLFLLGIDNSLDSLKTLHIGESYHHQLIEVIPNFYNEKAFQNGMINLRVDYCDNFDNRGLIPWAQNRKLQIFTDKLLDSEILKHIKGSVDEIVFYITEDNKQTILENIYKVINLGIKNSIVSKLQDSENQQLRINNFDLKIESEEKTEKTLDIDFKNGNLFYRSNKIILSENKLFPSKAAWKFSMLGGETGENKILKDDNFIEYLKEESEFLKIYARTN